MLPRPEYSSTFSDSLSEQERVRLTDRLTTRLMSNIDRCLLTDPDTAVKFSDTIDPIMPGLRFNPSNRPGPPLYWMNDAEEFMRTMDTNPGAYTLDCLNVVPLLLYKTYIDELREDGVSEDAIVRCFDHALIWGDRSTLLLNGRQVRPLSFNNTCYEDGAYYPTFTKAMYVGNQTEPVATIHPALQPGMFFYYTNIGIQSARPLHNHEAQNGIILSQSEADAPADTIRVFAHRPSIAGRDTTLAEVTSKLLSYATESDVPFDQYHANGGLEQIIAEIDYAGLYQAIRQSIANQPTERRPVNFLTLRIAGYKDLEELLAPPPSLPPSRFSK